MYEIWSLGHKPFEDCSSKEVHSKLIITATSTTCTNNVSVELIYPIIQYGTH